MWTHHLKDTAELHWSDRFYTGPAFTMGAGVQGFEAAAAAGAAGLVVVGGLCPSVGIAGGYLQGGGHSHLTTMFGLAADQTLSFEVVTAAGETVTASRTANPDLYWALSGGGAGTYGVVTAVTVRAYPDVPIGGVGMFLDPTQTTRDKYWAALQAFYGLLPAITDAGVALTFVHNASLFSITQLTAYNQTSDAVQALLSPFTGLLANLSIPFLAGYTDFPTYAAHWTAYYPESSPVGTFWQFGGRLVPRATIEGNLPALMDTLATFSDAGVLAGVTVVNATAKTAASNAVLPAWRSATVLYKRPARVGLLARRLRRQHRRPEARHHPARPPAVSRDARQRKLRQRGRPLQPHMEGGLLRPQLRAPAGHQDALGS